jgi:hypothetical protein
MSFQGTTRTKPYVRLSRIRLPPWVFDGEALIRPRMLDARGRSRCETRCFLLIWLFQQAPCSRGFSVHVPQPLVVC